MKKFLFLMIFSLSLTSLVLAERPMAFSSGDTTLASRYTSMAKQFFKKSRYDSAAVYFEKSGKIYQEYALQTNERRFWHSYISNWANAAKSLQRLGKNERSLRFFNQVLEVSLKKFGESDFDVARLYGQIGKFHQRNRDYDRALRNLKKGLAIVEKIYGPNSPKSILFYQNIGSCYYDSTAYDQAIAAFKKVLGVLKSNHQAESLRASDIYSLLGETYYTQGDYQGAIACFKKGIQIREKISGKNGADVAWFYNMIGNANYLTGNFDEAYECYQQVLFIFSKNSRKRRRAISSSYNNIGMIFFEKHDYRKALDYFQKALVLYRQQIKGENAAIVTPALNNIGLCHWKLGEVDSAITYFRQALKIRKRVYGENHPQVASDYHYLAEAYRLKHDVKTALKYYRKSLAINQAIFGRHHPKLAEDYNGMGTLLEENSRHGEALRYFQKAMIALVPSFSDSNIFHNPPIENRLSDKYLIYSLVHKAMVFSNWQDAPVKKQKNLLTAMRTNERASQLVDQIILSYRSEQSKLFVAKYEEQIAENAIETLGTLYALTGESDYCHQQFRFAQKAKFAVLQKSLYELKAKRISGIPDSLIERQNKIRQGISAVETHLRKELRKKGEGDSLKIADYRKKAFALKQDYRNLIDFFEKSYPEYYHLKYLPREVRVADVQAHLTSDDILLDYFVSKKNVRIFAIGRNDFSVKTMKIDSSFFEEINAFRSRIKKADLFRFSDASYRLYRVLIQPVEKLIQDKKKLIIVPHLQLYEIPFEALISRSMHKNRLDFSHAPYLIERFEVAYSPSAGLFLESFSKPVLADSRRAERTGGFVGFAPVFGKETAGNRMLAVANSPAGRTRTRRSVTIDGKHFAPLKHSKAEVDGIANLFLQKGRPALRYFYSDASEENFKLIAPNFKFVHIASHGIIDNENPGLSGIIFSQPTDSTAKEDGTLYAPEIYNLNLRADLIVLSSCQSGVGKLIRGEGLLSLTRGFLYAGAKNLLVSLWKVSDKQTSELMLSFYQNMLLGKSYSASLRQAKLELINNPKTAFPKFWSGFVLISG